MAAATRYTDEQKKAFVALAQKKGASAAARKANVSGPTVAYWAKALGVKLGRVKQAKTRAKKDATGKANGHATALEGPQPPPAPEAPSLDSLTLQLQAALESVHAIKAAFRQHFG